MFTLQPSFTNQKEGDHTLRRKDFLQLSTMGLGAMMLPNTNLLGNPIDVADLLAPGITVAAKKVLADVALNTAKSKGATYADIRIGRYLSQAIATRENRVQNRSEERRVGKECW